MKERYLRHAPHRHERTLRPLKSVFPHASHWFAGRGASLAVSPTATIPSGAATGKQRISCTWVEPRGHMSYERAAAGGHVSSGGREENNEREMYVPEKSWKRRPGDLTVRPSWV